MLDGPYRLPFCSVPVALTGAAQLQADGISSCCYIVNVHNHPTLATSRKEAMAWSSGRAMPSLWLQPQQSERVRSGCIKISEKKGWYNNAYTLQRHYTENSKQIFLEMGLCGLVPYSYIHGSVSNLYSLRILCSKISGPIVGIYKSFTGTWMCKLGLRPRSFFLGNT